MAPGCTRIGNKQVDLSSCGIFEMQNGKIKVWRDCFDMATDMKGASVAIKALQ